ncbi:hypothetical protein [uncultured Solobacterium sp.]|uniref:hypothetical protein n=1 Tax=uncultured Solobacterium sp. TaxID=747375 RepID=UPI0028EA4E59|nr:hypothetical protein [uncultured Solobacterium sp.]
MKSDNFFKELKAKRKVSYDEYVAYLKGKSEDEIAGLYIELQLKLEKIKRLSPWVCISGCSLMGLGFIANCKDMDINLSDFWQIMNTIGALFTIVYMMVFITRMSILYSEINLKRKLLIIDSYKKFEME